MAQVSKAMDVWMDELNTKSKHTREVYLLYFNRFLERWGIPDAEALYEMRRADLASDDTRDHGRIERMVKTYMSEMQAEGYKAGSCRQVSKAVGSFLETQGRTLGLNLKARDKPQGAYNGQRLALVDHIQDMWDYAPTETKQKTRAQLMFLKDSGIRISDLANLNLEDYVDAEAIRANGETFKKFWPTETEKTSEIAHIHIGPEAVNAVEEYLEVRETWKPRKGREDDKEPLFLNRFGQRFDAASIGMVFMRIGRRIGKKLSAHSLRKFHKTTLEGAGMPEQWIKKLQGKAADVYSLPEESGELTTKYIECYPALRVFGEEVTGAQIEEQADRISELEERNKELEAEAARLAAENEKLLSDIQSFRDDTITRNAEYQTRQDRNDAMLTELLKRIEKLEREKDEG